MQIADHLAREMFKTRIPDSYQYTVNGIIDGSMLEVIFWNHIEDKQPHGYFSFIVDLNDPDGVEKLRDYVLGLNPNISE